MIRAACRWAIPAMLLSVARDPQRLPAQENSCPNGVIRQIFIDNHSIFDVAEATTEGLLDRLRTIANRAHHRTRRGFIENELLFRTNDCLDPLLISESERLLRSHPFIADADVYPVPVEDGDVHVVVDTQDAWTLKLNVRPEFDDGFRITRAEVIEESLWGTGTRLGLFWREREERRDMGIDVRTPQLGGTRLDGQLTGGRTRTGTFFEEIIAYPFVGEVGRYAFIESFSLWDDLFSYATPAGSTFTRANLPVATQRAGVALGLRVGEPGDFTVMGVGVSWEDVAFGDFPSGVEIVPGNDFSARRPADPLTIRALTPQITPRRALRANFLAGKRNVRFITRKGLDAIRGEQDVRIGTQAVLVAGTTLGKPSTAPGNRSHEVRGGVSIFAGTAGSTWIFNSEVSLEGARVFAGATSPDAFRDVLGEFEASFYWQPARALHHTFVARLSGSGGWNSSLPFQLTLGGPRGVRGYDLEDFPAGQRLVLNIEDRIALEGPFAEVFDLGLAAFFDVGTGWRGEVPFGTDSNLQAAAGAGLRLGFPPGSRQVYAIDLALPLQSDGLQNIRFRFGVSEAVSLLTAFGDPQVGRSRSGNPAAAIFGIGSFR